MSKSRDATVSAGSLVWQQFFWPQPLTEATAFGLLRHWAAQTHAPQLILEARADVSGVEYLVGKSAPACSGRPPCRRATGRWRHRHHVRALTIASTSRPRAVSS